MKKLVLTVAACLLAGTAGAETSWQVLTWSEEKVLLLDMDSKVKNGNKVFAWLAQVYADDQRAYDLDVHGYEINCKNRTLSVEAVLYYKGGRLVNSDYSVNIKDFRIPPQSNGALYHKALCEPLKTHREIKIADMKQLTEFGRFFLFEANRLEKK